MRRCPKCDTHKPETEFHKCSARKDGLQLWCGECGGKHKMERYHAGGQLRVSKHARKQALRQYGLTQETYEAMLEKQHGACAICKLPETQRSNPRGSVDRLRVDHNHATGSVRGLLCSRCNFAIGHFRDNTDNMMAAIIYLLNDSDDEWWNRPLPRFYATDTHEALKGVKA